MKGGSGREYHVKVSERKVDNGGVLLDEEVVLGETIHVEDQETRELGDTIAFPLPSGGDKLLRLAVKLLEQGE